jgi:hypothetical protein
MGLCHHRFAVGLWLLAIGYWQFAAMDIAALS